MVASGYLVDPAALSTLATDLDGDATRLASLRGELSGAAPPAAAFGRLAQSATVSEELTACLGCVSHDLDTTARKTSRIAAGVSAGATGYQSTDTRIATGYEGLGAETPPARPLPVSAGGGDVSTVPFGDEIRANRAAVTEELAAERRRLAAHQAVDHANETNNGWLGWRSWDDNDADDAIAGSQARIATYESILADNRKILHFDPSGDGSMVELVGDIDADTRNVAVYVPGATAELADFDQYHQGARTFTDADPTGGLATVVWLGGDFPDTVLPDAASASYAQDMAPRLADFSHQLRAEIGHSAAAGNDVQLTVAGHSYGGPVVGTAEQLGLDADRVLHIASAGMGHDVHGPQDLHPHQPDVQRYSITAPGDPIRWVRDVGIGNLGHGADPEDFPGVVELETGRYADGSLVEGVDAHAGLVAYHSDAWWNIYHVFTGGPLVPEQQP